MIFKKWGTWGCALLLICVAMADVRAGRVPASTQAKPPEAGFITAEELKAKLAKNEPVTIIDVRSTNAYVESDNRIKGAIHLKLRRLKFRLTFPPLKDLPRDSEVITYCACPNDETSIRAAQVLSEAGFKRARVLKGGWQAWLKVNGQMESKPKL